MFNWRKLDEYEYQTDRALRLLAERKNTARLVILIPLAVVLLLLVLCL